MAVDLERVMVLALFATFGLCLVAGIFGRAMGWSDPTAPTVFIDPFARIKRMSKGVKDAFAPQNEKSAGFQNLRSMNETWEAGTDEEDNPRGGGGAGWKKLRSTQVARQRGFGGDGTSFNGASFDTRKGGLAQLINPDNIMFLKAVAAGEIRQTHAGVPGFAAKAWAANAVDAAERTRRKRERAVKKKLAEEKRRVVPWTPPVVPPPDTVEMGDFEIVLSVPVPPPPPGILTPGGNSGKRSPTNKQIALANVALMLYKKGPLGLEVAATHKVTGQRFAVLVAPRDVESGKVLKGVYPPSLKTVAGLKAFFADALRNAAKASMGENEAAVAAAPAASLARASPGSNWDKLRGKVRPETAAVSAAALEGVECECFIDVSKPLRPGGRPGPPFFGVRAACTNGTGWALIKFTASLDLAAANSPVVDLAAGQQQLLHQHHGGLSPLAAQSPNKRLVTTTTTTVLMEPWRLRKKIIVTTTVKEAPVEAADGKGWAPAPLGSSGGRGAPPPVPSGAPPPQPSAQPLPSRGGAGGGSSLLPGGGGSRRVHPEAAAAAPAFTAAAQPTPPMDARPRLPSLATSSTGFHTAASGPRAPLPSSAAAATATLNRPPLPLAAGGSGAKASGGGSSAKAPPREASRPSSNNDEDDDGSEDEQKDEGDEDDEDDDKDEDGGGEDAFELCCDSCDAWHLSRDVGMTKALALELSGWVCPRCAVNGLGWRASDGGGGGNPLMPPGKVAEYYAEQQAAMAVHAEQNLQQQPQNQGGVGGGVGADFEELRWTGASPPDGEEPSNWMETMGASSQAPLSPGDTSSLASRDRLVSTPAPQQGNPRASASSAASSAAAAAATDVDRAGAAAAYARYAGEVARANAKAQFKMSPAASSRASPQRQAAPTFSRGGNGSGSSSSSSSEDAEQRVEAAAEAASAAASAAAAAFAMSQSEALAQHSYVGRVSRL